jgi:hypothetical protein
MGLFGIETGDESAFGATLRRQAQGQGPSPAAGLLAANTREATRQMAGMAGSRQGVDSALALRNAMQAGADLNARNAQAAAAQRAQEQLNAQGLYGQYLQRRSDEQNAGVGTLLGGVGGALGMLTSDDRAKQGVAPGGAAADAFMDAASPRTYEYRDPMKGTGQKLGILAQDMQYAAPGLVQPGPDGMLQMDAAQLAGHTAAATGRLHDRLSAVEDILGLERSHQAAEQKAAMARDLAASEATPVAGPGYGRRLEETRRALPLEQKAEQQAAARRAAAVQANKAHGEEEAAMRRSRAQAAADDILNARYAADDARMIAAQAAGAHAAALARAAVPQRRA